MPDQILCLGFLLLFCVANSTLKMRYMLFTCSFWFSDLRVDLPLFFCIDFINLLQIYRKSRKSIFFAWILKWVDKKHPVKSENRKRSIWTKRSIRSSSYGHSILLLKQHGLTQLNIQIPGSSLGLKSGSSKQGSSSGPKTVKNEKTKKTRRAENVEEIGIKPQLNLGEKTAHLDITLPDEVEILSLIVYTSSGIRNSLLLPLSTAPFRKLVNLTTPPKRSKTREDWVRIKSKHLSWDTSGLPKSIFYVKISINIVSPFLWDSLNYEV